MILQAWSSALLKKRDWFAPVGSAAVLLAFPLLGLSRWGSLPDWLLLGAVWAFAQAALRPVWFAARFVPQASAAQLGFLRAWICLVALLPVFRADLAATARLPRELIVPMGVIDWLYLPPLGFEELLRSDMALAAFQAVTITLLAAALIGVKSRWSVPAAAIAYLVFQGVFRHYTRLYHHGLLITLLLTALAFTPAGDGFSVDAWLRRKRGGPEPATAPIAYGWARWFCWSAVALPYLLAGLSKLRNGGLFWWGADNLRTKMYSDLVATEALSASFGEQLAAAPDFIFAGFGLAALLTELGFLAVLFSRNARFLFPLMAVGMHLGILAFQGFLFYDAVLVHLIFYNIMPNRAARAARDAPARGSFLATAAFDLALVSVIVWLRGMEYYPLSSWTMYSSRAQRSRIPYYSVRVVRADGTEAPAPLGKCFPSTAGNSFNRMPRRAFDDGAEPLVRGFFMACAAEWNRDLGSENRIVAFRVSRREWDWKADGMAPPYGRANGERTIRVDGAKD